MGLLDIVKEERRRKAAGESPIPILRRPPSFAEQTGQARRLRIAQAIVILGGTTMVAGWWQMKRPAGVWLTLVGTVIGSVGFVAQCLAVRCPKCSVAVVWHTSKTRRASEAESAALYQVACPRCGHDPQQKDSAVVD